jgi:soluble lytic murein transglycosylase-like protein
MSKHTPGPWRYDEQRVAIVADVPPDWWTDDGDEEPIVQVVYLRAAMGGWNVAADRALIAAAPELLKAARKVCETPCPQVVREWMNRYGIHEALSAAIAKAEP